MDALKIISEGSIKAEKPQFNVGDTVRVDVRIKEGDRERILSLIHISMGTTKLVGGANSFRSLMMALVMRAGMPGSLGVMALTLPSSQ